VVVVVVCECVCACVCVWGGGGGELLGIQMDAGGGGLISCW